MRPFIWPSGLGCYDQHVIIAEKSHFALNGGPEMQRNGAMKTMSARETKNGFGLMIDTARAEPVLIEKRGRSVVAVVPWRNSSAFLDGRMTPEREQFVLLLHLYPRHGGILQELYVARFPRSCL